MLMVKLWRAPGGGAGNGAARWMMRIAALSSCAEPELLAR
jgi:hypothetical protein